MEIQKKGEEHETVSMAMIFNENDEKQLKVTHTIASMNVSVFCAVNGDCVPGSVHTYIFSLCVCVRLFSFHKHLYRANIKNSAPNSPTSEPFCVYSCISHYLPYCSPFFNLTLFGLRIFAQNLNRVSIHPKTVHMRYEYFPKKGLQVW